MDEIWKPVFGFEDKYEVSSLARVRSIDRIINGRWKKIVRKGKMLKPSVFRTGYYYFSFSEKEKSSSKKISLHRLVLLSFLGEPQKGMECCHIDGNKLNNRLENLRWDTHYNNLQDRMRHGRYDFGENCYQSKLTNDQAIYIYNSNEKGDLLAKRFGTNKQCISGIRRGKLYKKITGGIPRSKINEGKRINNGRSWVKNDDQV